MNAPRKGGDYGHAIGDKIIVRAAAPLTGGVRAFLLADPKVMCPQTGQAVINAVIAATQNNRVTSLELAKGETRGTVRPA
jgi:hypothetical protein